MHFRVAARTILHLGAELISSDSVAFYELIKNAFDARSPRVWISVVVRCPKARDLLREARGAENKSHRTLSELRERVLREIDRSAPRSDRYIQRVQSAESWPALIRRLREANYIEIVDKGRGMSLNDLKQVYLTIGTRSRLIERNDPARIQDEGDRPILGEKGVGRLSAMRLGSLLKVTTSKAGETHWNELKIDWDDFSHESDKEIQDIPVDPQTGSEKDGTSTHGTTIRIAGLSADWSEGQLAEIAREEFSKFSDPFTPASRYPVILKFNDESVPVPEINRVLFEHAHATVQAQFIVPDDEMETPRLVGRVNYLLAERANSFELTVAELSGITGRTPSLIRALGSFRFELYWYNRQALAEVEGIGTKKQVANLVNAWSGGLMVFRDGFRVNPYGSASDDWLDLDSKALASSGYKVNRKQIIGKVDISRHGNPALTDQTNREGLRESDEKRVLVAILKHILEVRFRAFLNQVDRDRSAIATATIEELKIRVVQERKEIRQVMDALVRDYPEVGRDKKIKPLIEESLEKIVAATNEIELLASNYERRVGEMLHLAGMGLMVEILAHELFRATSHALETVNILEDQDLEQREAAAIKTLGSQLKTLRKRLQILDPINTTARQIKTEFNLKELLQEVLDGRAAQFERHGIKVRFKVEGSGRSTVKMVRGMFVQVIDNLLSNSVYWLKQMELIDAVHKPEIEIILDTDNREIRVTDNGPGVASKMREHIFGAFVTTKPPGEGKGLGLYISREIAKYHKAELFLAKEPTDASGRLHTFVFKYP